MTDIPLVITHWFGLVPLCMVYGYFMLIFATTKVMSARKEHNINYPNLYADRTIDGEEKANKFNSVQRAHQNTLEMFHFMMVLMFVNGLFSPRLSSELGFVYITCRLFYVIGYGNKGPEGRKLASNLSFLCMGLFVILSIYNGVVLLLTK